ncbi:MAG: GGDEF domain-containing protein [Anaeromyxobacteraceae bacterium]
MNFHVDRPLSPVLLCVVGVLAVACLLLAAAFVRARRRIGEMTLLDELTGLGTRRLMARDIPREISRSRREGLTLFVGVADVDRLAPYNLAFGRPAGHAVLAAIGAILRGSLRRAGDHVFRSGGDRFTFAFSSERRMDGAEMAERIRARVLELDRRHTGNPPHEAITVSIGLVRVEPGAVATLEGIEERAAEALALARKEGRNRVAGLDIDGDRFRTGDGIPLPPTSPVAPRPAGSEDATREWEKKAPR